MKIYADNIFDESSIEHDSYIEMKCINCGYEELIPSFVYGEEAEFLEDCGDPEPPCFACANCGEDTLYRKGITIPQPK